MASIVIILVSFLYYMIYPTSCFSFILDTNGVMYEYTSAVFDNGHIYNCKCTQFSYS